MTRRRDVERHRHSLDEIRGILNSMKTLSYMENRKLSRFLSAQHAVIDNIDQAAADFLAAYPGMLPELPPVATVNVLVGSERGFCGDFNHAVLRHGESAPQENSNPPPKLIAIGRKLHTLLEDDARVAAFIPGASVAEEASIVLNRLVDELAALQAEHGVLTVDGYYHTDTDAVRVKRLLPPFRHLQQATPLPHPPLLNQPPREFLLGLTDQYLYAALNEILFTSLRVENHKRVSHLQGAVDRLEVKTAELGRLSNQLRQEEIVEEIEIILLSSGYTSA